LTTLILVTAAAAGAYLVLSIAVTYLVQQFPRRPLKDPPDWGRVKDARIPTVGGGRLEVWRIEPEGPSHGIVVFAHGWGRNRDRMVPRARLFARWGYTVVIHSARDHGGSSPKCCMHAARFAEDIEAVLDWVGRPVILYGHSAGSAGAIIAADHRPHDVRLLFLEGVYADTKEALKRLYYWFNPLFGLAFANLIVFWMDLFYGGRLKDYSPEQIAPRIQVPVMLIHGEKDGRFPPSYAERVRRHLPHDNTSLYIAPGVGHSDSSRTPGYPHAVKAFLDRYDG